MRHFPFVRLTAAAVSAALIVVTPGVGTYEAAAQMVRSAPAGASPVVPVIPAAPMRASGAYGLTPSAPVLSLPGAMTVLPTVSASPRVTAQPAAAAQAVVAAPQARAALSTPLRAEVAASAEAPLPSLAPVAEAVRAAAPTPAASGVSNALTTFSTLFDGGRLRSVIDAVTPGAASRSRGFSGLSVNAAREEEDSAGNVIPTPTPAPAQAAARPYFLSLALAGLGAGAAYLLIPALLPMAIALPYVAALPALAVKSALVVLGFGLGASLAETELWRSWPREVVGGALDAGRTAFRFWARFGLVFRSVLSASSIDEAMKADLPGLFWKYPLLAWPFVVVGYVFAPVVTVVGAAFKALEIPARAAFRGVRRIVVGLLPFMADVFSFIGRAIRSFIPAAGAFLYKGATMAMMTAVGGAVVLAAPVWNSLVKGPYAMERDWDAKPSQFPAAVAMVLGRALGLVASVFLGAVGGLVGFTVGLPLTLTEALLAFAAKVAPEGAAARAYSRWTKTIERSAELEAFHRVGTAASRRDFSTLPRALARFAAAAPGAVYSLPFSVAGTLGLFVVALAAAFGFERAPAARQEAPARPDERDTSAPVIEEYAGSPWLPLTLALAGAVVGLLFSPLLLTFVPMMWLPAVLFNAWALNLAGALLGAAAGLAFSQPKAWFAIVSTSFAQAKAAAADAFRLWARLGLASRVNVTGKPVDEALFAGTPAALTRYPLLAWPAVVVGYVAAAAGFVVGGAAAAAGVPVKAAWKGLVILLTSGLIRRILTGIKNVLRHGIPFAFGFVWGALTGLVRTAVGGAVALGAPVLRSVVVADGENPYRRTGLTGLVLKRLVQALGLVSTLAAGVVGLVVGAVTFAPHWLTSGLAKGLKWGSADNRFTKWLWRWEKNLEHDMSEVSGARLAAVLASNPKEEAGLWQGVVRAANGLVYAASSVLWAVPVSLALYARAAANASRSDKPVLEEWTEPRLADDSRARPESFVDTVKREAADAFMNSFDFWENAGHAWGYAVLRDEKSLLAGVFYLPAFVLAVAASGTGAVAGAVEVPARAFLSWVKDVALKFLPFLKRVWNLAMRVAKRVFPFLGGLIGGAVMGVVGSAAFGALLLGRPWFKYVVAQDYDTSSVGKFLGVAALRVIATLAGAVFGVLGLAFGLLAAVPYSLTYMVALAFQWGGIGGKSEFFFRHWTAGAMPVEMKRLSKLTDSFDFSKDKDSGELPPMDGWIRLGMVTAATFAAALAATIAGYVAWFRSLGAAYRSARDGRELPQWGASGDVVEDAVGQGSKIGRKTGLWLGELAGLAAAAAIAFGFFAAPTWLGALGSGLGLLGLVVLSGPAGWLAGLIVGAVAGALVGMLMWLDKAIKSAPDAQASAKDDGTPGPQTRKMGGGAVDIVPATFGALFAAIDPLAALVGAAAGVWLGGRGVQEPGAPWSWGGAVLGAVIASLVSSGMWMMYSGGLGGLMLIGIATALGIMRVSAIKTS